MRLCTVSRFPPMYKNLNVEGAFLFPFEDGSAFTWSRRGNLVWRNKNEYESATSERGQFEMLTQVGNKGKNTRNGIQ